MNRAFGGIEGGGIVAAGNFCNEAFLRVIHPSIHPLIPTQFVPFYFCPLQVDALEERRRDVPLLVSRICEGKCSFSYSSESEERCGRCNNRSHAMQLCNCRVPANCPANQPQPDRRARRGEGWSGDWIGTTELWKAAGWRWVRATTTYGWLWSVRPRVDLTHLEDKESVKLTPCHQFQFS